MRFAAVLTCVIALGSLAAYAAPVPLFVKPGKDEKCPVCGMFVFKFPVWAGQIAFADGSRSQGTTTW